MAHAREHNWGTNLDPSLIRFWGKPLNRWELSICDVMGWAQRQGPYTDGHWHLTSKAARFPASVYYDGFLGKWQCSGELRRFLKNRCLPDLYQFFGKARMFGRLSSLLHLTELTIEGRAVCNLIDGVMHFAAAAPVVISGSGSRSGADKAHASLLEKGCSL